MMAVDSRDSSLRPGMLVYVPDKEEVWIQASLVDVTKDVCTVQLTWSKEERKCSMKEVLPCPGQSLAEINSLTELSPINQASVLSCLHERCVTGLYYTNAGSTIVAVNPFYDVPHLYSLEQVLLYHNQSKDAPHIYQVGSAAYRTMCSDLGNKSQCIIVSGESGSGKTVSAKHLLRYMTLVSNTFSDDRPLTRSMVSRCVERRILDSNPILEAFGNAVTQRNSNSSRFGKFVQLQFSSCGHMVGGEIQTYLLEKTRVVHQSPGESNFHIFYQILSSLREATETPLGQLVTSMSVEGFNILPPQTGSHDNHDLTVTLAAMVEIGISQEQQNDIIRILVAIMFLGNIEFTPLEDDICKMLEEGEDKFLDTTVFELEVSQTALEQTADLLGVSSAHIEQTMLFRSIQSGGASRRSIFVKPVPQREAYSRRDCLATLMYARLFEWLVGFINKQIHSDKHSHSIGLLDIYGFETFQTNSLEQLCINYANEKLQQHYVQHFLRDLQREYESECIDWHHLSYTDNQPCLNVLEGQPSVFGLLNEDVQLNRKCDSQQLCERILQLCASAPLYVKRPRTFMRDPGFTIQHYAGDVTYSGETLSNKNKDNIPQELISLLKNSSNSFVSQLFEMYTCDDSSGRRRKTVLGKFKVSLDSLMQSLHKSDAHYIRCVKPNRVGQPGLLDRPYVMSQLVGSGIIETVKISCHGYPARMVYSEFLQRYGMLIRATPPGHGRGDSGPKQGTEDCDSLFEPLEALYRKQINMACPRQCTTPRKKLRRRAVLSSIDHLRRCCATVLSIQFGTSPNLTQQFGKTKLFLHQHQIESLEGRRQEIVCDRVTTIQRHWRAYKVRQKLRQHRHEQQAATTILQYWRAYKVRREMHQHRHEQQAAATIQAAWRRFKHTQRQTAVLTLQKAIRMHLARQRFSKLCQAKENQKTSQRSWKPIIDRKRSVSRCGSRSSSRSSKRSSGEGQRSDTSTSSLLGSVESSNSVAGTHAMITDMDTSIENHFQHGLVTSTPFKKPSEQKSNGETDTGPNQSVNGKNKMKKGRPNMSPQGGLVHNLRTGVKNRGPAQPFGVIGNQGRSGVGAIEDETDSCMEGVPAVKKQRTMDGSVATLLDLTMGDGIMTRRRLPKVPIRFHTRPSVLKNAHLINQKELTCEGLQDCLPNNQSDHRKRTQSKS